MFIFVTRYQTLFTLVLALLLGTSCSDQGSTSAPKSEVSDTPTPVEQAIEVAAPVEEQAVAEAFQQAAVQTAVVDGQKTYQTYCKACHATGVAGAPKLGDKAAWAPRISKGDDAMFSTVIKGLNAMPPKGACMSCSDNDLRAAMEYMVSQGS